MDEGGSAMTDRRRAGDDPQPGVRAVPDASAAGSEDPEDSEPERERRLRRARFLAELAEARELRKRVAPRRTRAAELHERVLRTFRY
ncbi:hypothetical protein KGA66_15395 [Actinocrinis puniceicyclus]|uniref:Uncharacterized protein n=1 Tax=Actinocrinis puniceicyclus TaxID=977794 RepID=A0A8J7WR35_9ACTN|nr:hypothetical protein [Actinocrinis puniceicyclus]MBS2964442.1 hypothetical protein [Actinocrinis puniceicyclus]